MKSNFALTSGDPVASTVKLYREHVWTGGCLWLQVGESFFSSRAQNISRVWNGLALSMTHLPKPFSVSARTFSSAHHETACIFHLQQSSNPLSSLKFLHNGRRRQSPVSADPIGRQWDETCAKFLQLPQARLVTGRWLVRTARELESQHNGHGTRRLRNHCDRLLVQCKK